MERGGRFSACGSKNIEVWSFIYSYFKIKNTTELKKKKMHFADCKLSTPKEKEHRGGEIKIFINGEIRSLFNQVTKIKQKNLKKLKSSRFGTFCDDRKGKLKFPKRGWLI